LLQKTDVGRFNHIRQVAPSCPPMRAHWRHLANTIELMLPSAHKVHNPNCKSIVSAVFAQLAAECRPVHWLHLVNTIELVHIGATWHIRLNLCFLRPTRVQNPNGKSIHSAISAQLTAESHYTLQWAPLSPKIALYHAVSGPQSNTLFLGPIRAHNPNGIMIG